MEELRTFDEWRKRGFSIRKGEKSCGRNESGQAIFSASQIESKTSTFAAKMGMDDPDLTTPEHDAIMLWLDKNIKDAVAYLMGENGLPFDKIDRIENKWEAPLVCRGMATSYADMMTEVHYRTGRTSKWVDSYGKKVEEPEGDYIFFLFEVKPKIPSVGELVRQMRHMELILRSTVSGKFRMAVVSPDDRFCDVLRSQSIYFVKAPNV